MGRSSKLAESSPARPLLSEYEGSHTLGFSHRGPGRLGNLILQQMALYGLALRSNRSVADSAGGRLNSLFDLPVVRPVGRPGAVLEDHSYDHDIEGGQLVSVPGLLHKLQNLSAVRCQAHRHSRRRPTPS
jgi:hypothetical protein